ncbi:MAG: hypothetical protein A2Y76_01655 [Planctomycetes bacterium RBG_13_60_9]|nr:MAG: hypothetical protein A2Y76_01655 [Planctomycetes bacterium RBG_13_60_9]
MALACTGKISVSITLAQTNELDLSTPTDSVSKTYSRTLASGTAADQVDLIWHDSRSLTNGATESLALNDASLTGAFGTITFDKVKGICIANTSTENGLKIGGAAANQLGLFSDTTDILILPAASATNKPSIFLFEAPAAVGIATTTNDELKFASTGTTTNTLTYEIIIWGED